MAWWGALLTAAYLSHHLALNGTIGDGETIFALIWIPFSIVGVIGHFVLLRLMPGKAGAGSAGNRASRSVWLAAGLSIASMAVGTASAAATGAGPATFDWIVPVAFAVYACALIVTGSLGKDRTIVLAGVGAGAMVGLFTALILSPDRYLIAAVGVFLTVLVPGLLLLRAEPR